MQSETKHILIISGEASGDQHGAELIAQINQPNIQFTAMGGQHLRAAGANIIVDANELSVVGFFEVFKIFGKIINAYRTVSKYIKQQKPDLVILIDYPGFNLRMARVAKRAGCNVLYYISPQLWAWRPGRVKIIQRFVDQMAVILPFEVDFYRRFGVNAHYVGHPLLQHLATLPSKTDARQQLNLLQDDIVIGLLPGSRIAEIQQLLPSMITAIKLLRQHYPSAKVLLNLADTLSENAISPYLQDTEIQITHDLYANLKAADILIATSGTVTLQAGLANTPMVVVYRGSPLSYFIARLLVKVKHICLCNIIAGRTIVTELIQSQATPTNIVAECRKLLESQTYTHDMQHQLRQMTATLQEANNTASLPNLVNQLLSP